MDTLKISTRALLVCAVVLLVVLLTGPLGYKFELAPLSASLYSLLIAALGGGLVLLVGLVYLAIAIKGQALADRNCLLIILVLAALPVAIMAPQIVTARSVPAIHDITTDTANPPRFVALHGIRSRSPNGAEYGASEAWPAAKLMAAQAEAYPHIQPLMSDLSPAAALERAEQVAHDMGLEVAAVDRMAGQLEATATTFWFGFKDDLVVRVRAGTETEAGAGGSRVDLRSMSRLGRSDLGANAARIAEFARRFNAD